MNDPIHIFGWDFNDEPLSWEPEDPIDFEFWMTVTVGDGEGGSNYQVHVCSAAAMPKIENQRNTFTLSEWSGIEDLIRSMNRFVAEKQSADQKSDPYRLLSKYWKWEYQDHSSS